MHADAEENDEKRESFEDLPEHLRLGTEFTLRVTVLQVQSSPMKGKTADFELASSVKTQLVLALASSTNNDVTCPSLFVHLQFLFTNVLISH